MINQYLKSMYGWLREKAQEIRSWLDQQVPVASEKGREFQRGAQEQVRWFCTSPLGKAE